MKTKFEDFFINSIVYNNNPIIELEKNDKKYENKVILYNELIDGIDNFIKRYNSMAIFDDYIVENLYKIINYLRYNYPYNSYEDKSEKYDIYNLFIRSLNSNFQTNSIWFYSTQCLERGIYIDHGLEQQDIYVTKKLKEDVRTSMCHDELFYNILTKNVNSLSEEDYNMLIMNPLFIYSINYFLFECSEILDNNEILKKVLLENNRIINSLKYKLSDNNKKVKSLEKNTKNFIKILRW